MVVILWHWCFTILIWTPGAYATSPLGFTSGLWIFTWLLQVMPIFFYIGAYVHLKSWERAPPGANGSGTSRCGRPGRWRSRRCAAGDLVSFGVIVGLVFDVSGWPGRC